MLRKAFKFRLYPTSAQETVLCDTLETCCDLYNSLLHQRKHDYELFGKSPSYSQQQKQLPIWKETHPELCQVHSQVLQNVVVRVDLAFQAFFRRGKAGENPGYPRFKGKGQYDSITYPQVGEHGGAHFTDDGLYLSKIGILKVVVHRPIEGKVKTCTLRRQGEKWYVCFSCEVEVEPLPPSDSQVGIDVGLEKFTALSNGESVENPRFFRKDEKALAKAQRKFDKVKHKHGSKARHKAKKVVRRIHERIRNRRHDFVHQTARKLINTYGLIAVEDLNIKNMSRSPSPKQDEATGEYLPNGHAAKAGLNKSLSDASWHMFRSVLTQKAESAARVVIAVDPAYTSQDCSECGNRVPKALSERIHICLCCGLILDRDVNAARNILRLAVLPHSVTAETV